MNWDLDTDVISRYLGTMSPETRTDDGKIEFSINKQTNIIDEATRTLFKKKRKIWSPKRKYVVFLIYDLVIYKSSIREDL